jgi:hypothetical protein
MGDCGKEGSDGGIGVKLKELYEDEKRRIVERASLGRLPSTRPEVCALFEYFFRKEEEIEAF